MVRKRPSNNKAGWLAGAWPWALLLLLVAAGALLFWYAYYKGAFRGLFINDAYDYASIAHNIALGRGVRSEYLTPLGLAHLGVPQPDLWRAPLWPLLLALFQRIFGFKDPAAALAGGACFGAGACLVFLLGRRWFNWPVAIAASLLYIFSSQLLVFSVTGLTEPLAVLLMLGWFYLLTGPSPGSWWQPLLAGAAGGLFYLARYNAALFFVPALVYLWWRLRQNTPELGRHKPRPAFIRTAALFLLGLLLITGPWLGRNYLLTGNPLFSLQKYEPAMFTATYPDYSLYMQPAKIDVIGFIRAHPSEMTAKVATGWTSFTGDFFQPEFTGVSLGVMILFLLALLLPLGLWFPAQRGVRWLLAACFLLQLGALLPIHYISRLFIIFAPFCILYAAAGVWVLGRLAAAGIWGRLVRSPELRGGSLQNLMGPGSPATVAVTVLILAIFTLSGIRANYPDLHPPSEGPHPLSMWGEQHLRDVQGYVTGDQVVASDIGHFFAWYGDRYACKLPLRPQLLPQLGALAPIRAVFLSHWITWDQPEADPAWLAIYRTRPSRVDGFALARVYPDGSLLYIRGQMPEAGSRNKL